MKKRKPITKKGWAIRWADGVISFYYTRRAANNLLKYYDSDDNTLFRCQITETEK
jgi:hypothetical protein